MAITPTRTTRFGSFMVQLPSQQKLVEHLLGTDSNERSKERGADYKREMAMLPTVDHVTAEPVPDFEIVSWQTNDAKGDMPPEEFIAYCRRVVQVADRQGSNRR